MALSMSQPAPPVTNVARPADWYEDAPVARSMADPRAFVSTPNSPLRKPTVARSSLADDRDQCTQHKQRHSQDEDPNGPTPHEYRPHGSRYGPQEHEQDGQQA